MVPVEMLEEQVQRGEDRSEQPRDERYHEGRSDDSDGEDRERPAHEEHDESNGSGAERGGECHASHQGLLLEFLDG
jgi:hypothetical protein